MMTVRPPGKRFDHMCQQSLINHSMADQAVLMTRLYHISSVNLNAQFNVLSQIMRGSRHLILCAVLAVVTILVSHRNRYRIFTCCKVIGRTANTARQVL